MTNRPILVGIDGSEPSGAALRWACREATVRGTGLVLVHAEARPPLVDFPADPDVTVAPRGNRPLTDAERQARRLAPGAEVQAELVDGGTAAAALIQRATDAALVVVGNRGHGGFVGLLLGSIALQVAGHAPCPVALVKARTSEGGHGPIVAGVAGMGSVENENVENAEDVEEVEDVDAGANVEAAFREASLHGRRLRIVSAWRLPVDVTPMTMAMGGLGPRFSDLDGIPADMEERLSEALIPWREKYPGVAVEVTVVNDRARHALIDASAGAEMLVVGRHDEGGPHILPLGSVASAVAHHADCPVLIT